MSLQAWAEAFVALLLVFSGVFVLLSAFGFLRLPGFFLRMHPPALAYTLGSWCVAVAGVLYFSVRAGWPVLHPLLIPILLVVTVPVTTVLLARLALFRQRLAGTPGTPGTLTRPGAQPPPDGSPPAS